MNLIYSASEISTGNLFLRRSELHMHYLPFPSLPFPLLPSPSPSQPQIFSYVADSLAEIDEFLNMLKDGDNEI